MGISRFWAAAEYSATVGTSRAREMQAELWAEPGVVIYSERSLSLHGPGVRERTCANPDAAYRYGYAGLKLVLQSGDQYLFLPER